jgi:hypothetical protein
VTYVSAVALELAINLDKLLAFLFTEVRSIRTRPCFRFLQEAPSQTHRTCICFACVIPPKFIIFITGILIGRQDFLDRIEETCYILKHLYCLHPVVYDQSIYIYYSVNTTQITFSLDTKYLFIYYMFRPLGPSSGNT